MSAQHAESFPAATGEIAAEVIPLTVSARTDPLATFLSGLPAREPLVHEVDPNPIPGGETVDPQWPQLVYGGLRQLYEWRRQGVYSDHVFDYEVMVLCAENGVTGRERQAMMILAAGDDQAAHGRNYS